VLITELKPAEGALSTLASSLVEYFVPAGLISEAPKILTQKIERRQRKTEDRPTIAATAGPLFGMIEGDVSE